MLSKIVTLGNKIELKKVSNTMSSYGKTILGEDVIYYSQVFDVVDEHRIRIGMPLIGGRVIPLTVSDKYDACFYTDKGLYQCRIVITDRYKENNIFVLVVELISELQKYQRRQYYRLGCTMDIKYRILEEEEIKFYSDENNRYSCELDDKFNDGIALDLSGGGIRFTSKKHHKPGEILLLFMDISYDDKQKEYCVLCQLVTSDASKNREDMFEHRAKYCNIDGGIREELIKYIFEEERKQRKREKG